MSVEKSIDEISNMRRATRLALGLLLPLTGVIHLFGPGSAHAARFATETTLVLYDAASGAIPSAALMTFTDFPPAAALPGYADGATILDTTTMGSDTYAGWVSNSTGTSGYPALHRSDGFRVNFTLQVEDESHSGIHRAGFSLIALSEDTRGIELAFWENEIWAQSDDLTGGLFRHGEGIAFATTSPVEYQLTIAGDGYTLTANANPVLSGPLRDYKSFDGFPDPYETPNFLFLGDDTTSAQARVRLSYVSVTGTQRITPTVTSAVASTSTPAPSASLTPLPSATPVPSATPAGRAVELCPSGWLLLAVIVTSAGIAKRKSPA